MRAPYTVQKNRNTQLGFIVLQADETIEQDLRRLIPDDVEYLVSRVPSGSSVTPDTLREMADNLTAAASLFPSGAHLDCVAYACTSGTAEIGAARISELVRDGVETPVVTDPVSALVSACRTLDVTRLALLSPYVASVSDRLREVLESAGITVTNLVSFEEPDEARVVRIDENSIHDAVLKCVEQAPCDAVFLSCTNLRTLDVLPRIETATGLPVLSSNLVLAWHMLRLSGRALAPDVPSRLATQGAIQGESSR